jgi:hypothetical protein
MFNGMVQAIVSLTDRDQLMSLAPWDMNNTMSDNQMAHHVTLGFKPSDDEMQQLVDTFFGKEIIFNAKEVRWTDRICAVFGHLTVHLSDDRYLMLPELRHITLGGTVSPRLAADLAVDPSAEVEPLKSGSCVLQFHVVDFDDADRLRQEAYEAEVAAKYRGRAADPLEV